MSKLGDPLVKHAPPHLTFHVLLVAVNTYSKLTGCWPNLYHFLSTFDDDLECWVIKAYSIALSSCSNAAWLSWLQSAVSLRQLGGLREFDAGLLCWLEVSGRQVNVAARRKPASCNSLELAMFYPWLETQVRQSTSIHSIDIERQAQL